MQVYLHFSCAWSLIVCYSMFWSYCCRNCQWPLHLMCILQLITFEVFFFGGSVFAIHTKSRYFHFRKLENLRFPSKQALSMLSN